MTIASAIAIKQQQVADSYTAVSNKGGTLPATQNLTNLATAISSIPSGGGGSEKYGTTAGSLLGDVDANGVYQTPTEQYDVVMTGVEDIADYGLYFKFYRTGIRSISFPDLTTVSSGLYNMQGICRYCSNLTTVSFPKLATLNSDYTLSYAFANCPNLTSITFSKLTTTSNKQNAMQYMCSNCTSLTSVSFPELTTIAGTSTLYYAFQNCTALTDVYFPALKTTSFGSLTSQFNNMLASTGTNVTHTLHFPSNIQTQVAKLKGYPLFGGTDGYVTIAFDLPATS